ncbi:MAG: hypothetical protein JXQ71_02120 [Verrucomicrobia bacterium]|nr:hypothetical protein [Verrucomicrobiota bacterium]
MNSPGAGISSRTPSRGIGSRPRAARLRRLWAMAVWLWVAGGVAAEMVILPPVIYEQPGDQAVLAGGRATFAVTASSNVATFFQWRFLDRPILGAEEAVLVLSNVDLSQAGSYSVVVANAGGAVTSSPATLRIIATVQTVNWDPIVIPDWDAPGLARSTIAFDHVDGVIARMSAVCFVVNHSRPDDLDLGLLGPQGQFVHLMSDAGNGWGITNVFLEFDDEGAVLADEGPLTGGAYHPANYAPDDDALPAVLSGLPASALSAFTAQDPQGAWTLFVADDSPGHGGELPSGWGLDMTLHLREPHAFMVGLQPPAAVSPAPTSASGFGLVRLETNGLVFYSIAVEGLAGEFWDASIRGPGTNNSPASKLFPLAYEPRDDRSGVLQGVVTNYQGQQFWQLRRSRQFVEIRTSLYPLGELAGPIVPLPLPEILHPPKSQTAIVGGTVVFGVEATNPAPLTYQWRQDWRPLPGATNATLALADLRPSQAGSYDVAVRNLAGVVFSPPAELRLEGEPVFEWIALAPGTRGSRWLHTLEPQGMPHTTPCGPIGVSSRFLGLLPEGDGTLMLDTAGSALRTVMAVYAGDTLATMEYLGCDAAGTAADYCRWDTATCGTATPLIVEVDGLEGQQGDIAVNWRFGAPPQVFAADTNLTVLAGEPAVLAAEATGVPVPDVQWQFRGVDLAGATNATHVIPRADAADAGDYRVRAVNFMGAAAASVHLRVLAPPRIAQAWIERGWFHCQVLCSPESHVVLMASPDLIGWHPVCTNDAPQGMAEFVDTNAATWPRRFYRAEVR